MIGCVKEDTTMKHFWFLTAILATPIVPFLSDAACNALLARAGRPSLPQEAQ